MGGGNDVRIRAHSLRATSIARALHIASGVNRHRGSRRDMATCGAADTLPARSFEY
jgi:hypothetical protein